MPELSGNKGEWSEIYVFLRLLETGKLYAADGALKRIDDVFYDVIQVNRAGKEYDLEFRRNELSDTVEVICDGRRAKEVPTAEFGRMANHLLSKIGASVTGSFAVPVVEGFLTGIGVHKVKADSTDKSDIKIKIHDVDTGFDTVQGFSIKSRLGNPSTLINAGKTTNFVYEVTGGIDDSVMAEFNSGDQRFSQRFAVLERKHCDVSFIGMENETFEGNLRLIDGDLPEICAEMLKLHYASGVSNVEAALQQLKAQNPLDYNLSMGHPFYRYKFKRLLSECALGMLPSKTWDGTLDATGGYIVVREDGAVLCYHLYNHNEFENYLVSNTKFETASTSRHEFGSIYKEDGKYYLKLNLQVRFIH